MECVYSFPSMHQKSRNAFKTAMKHDDFNKIFNAIKRCVGNTGEAQSIAFCVDGSVFSCRISRHYDDSNYEHYIVVTVHSEGTRLQHVFQNYRYSYQSA